MCQAKTKLKITFAILLGAPVFCQQRSAANDSHHQDDKVPHEYMMP